MKRTDTLRAVTFVVLILLVGLLFYKVALQRPAPRMGPGVIGVGGGPSTSLSRTDANGVAWAIDQAGGGPLPATEPNGPKAGPPIMVRTSVQRVADREVSIGLVLEGQAGEQYRPAVKKDGTTLSPPGLRIVNEAGQVVAQGSFQYG